MTTTPLPPLPRPCIYEGDDSPLYDAPKGYDAGQMQAFATQACADLEAEVQRLREALRNLFNAIDSCVELTPEVMLAASTALETRA